MSTLIYTEEMINFYSMIWNHASVYDRRTAIRRPATRDPAPYSRTHTNPVFKDSRVRSPKLFPFQVHRTGSPAPLRSSRAQIAHNTIQENSNIKMTYYLFSS